MRKTLILCSFMAVMVFAIFASQATAWQFYEQGCAPCHPDITDRGPGHNIHMEPTNNDCNFCHAGGEGNRNSPPLANCVPCHGRDQDVTPNDGAFGGPGPGLGDGLRAHHAWAGITQCAGCHNADTIPVGENVMPSYYPGPNATTPLNSCDGSEERFASNSVSLDNDGDGLTDGDDPDCAVDPCAGVVCDTPGTCEMSPGNCVDGTCIYDPIVCPPGESCNPATGVCEAPPACTVDADCDDGDPCTTDTCQSGSCSNLDCPPGQTCDPNTGCISGCTADSQCDNGLYCDGAETCNMATGECMAGMSPCQPGETCDETRDMCMAPPMDEVCNDGMDNDGDGRIDCDDPDCSMDPACPMEKTGCLFNPPGNHTDCEDGCRHAPGKEKPFTNGCTDCHGANLMGDFAPSCFTCHGPEWDERAMDGRGCISSDMLPDFHKDSEDGCLHAPGKEKPFTNGCTDCHGDNLTGGFGPSCYTCHGPEWDERAMDGRGCISSDMLPDFHKDSEDGCLHAPGKEMPFTNGCTECHGVNLMGDFGPSCYTCHGPEWDEKSVGMGCKDDDDRDDHDQKSKDDDKSEDDDD